MARIVAVLQALEGVAATNPDGVVDQRAYHGMQARETEKAAPYSRLLGQIA